METFEVTFVVPEWITEGLKTQTYERLGGVIRDAQTKHVIAMLREGTPNLSQASTLSQFSSLASILNLSVSLLGFGIVIKQLGEIEQRLKQIEEEVYRIEQKTDLSILADFRAALNLARIALTMDTKPENRKSKLDTAIEKMLIAQELYFSYANIALKEKIEVADEYISFLFLAYITEVHCHLELEEIETARLRLQESAENIRHCVHYYVNDFLQRQAVSHRHLKEKLAGELSCMAVREIIPLGLGKLFWEDRKEHASNAFIQVAQKNSTKYQTKEKIAAMIENYRRFEAYQVEVQAFVQLGISFHDWLKLAPSKEFKAEKANLMYIIPSRPLQVALQEDGFQNLVNIDFMYEVNIRIRKEDYFIGGDLVNCFFE